MPEFRRDLISGRSVILTPARASRPNIFAATANLSCPFCVGRESETPPEVLARRPPQLPANGPGWTIRVVPNKFPAVDYTAPGARPRRALSEGVFFESEPGTGVHEVIIESPRHVESLAELTEDEMVQALTAYRDRILELRGKPGIRYALLFKNEGRAAGASLGHIHSQLIALPRVPESIRQSLHRARRFQAENGLCIFCELIQREMLSRERVIEQSAHFVTLSQYAARFPYESCIYPKSHQACFEQSTPEELRDLAGALKRWVLSLAAVTERPSYNLTLHTSPMQKGAEACFHWRLELTPRLGGIAGFELATGWNMNTVTPEQAAEQLRGARTANPAR